MSNRGPTTKSTSKKPPENSKENFKSRRYRQPSVEDESSESEVEVERPMKFGPPKRKKKVKIVTPEVSDNETFTRELPFSQVQPLASVSRPKTIRTSREDPIPITGKKFPAYRNKAPIENHDRIDDIVAKALKTPLSLSTEDLMVVSKDFRDGLKNLVTRKKIANDGIEVKKVNLSDLAVASDSDSDGDYDRLSDDAIMVSDLPLSSFKISTVAADGVPLGSIICEDPVVQYYDGLAPGEEPKQIVVAARESQSLRTVYPLINAEAQEECVLDGGSQIVSMSKVIAEELGIPWNPDIKVHMQSANKQVEKTLGLARNVPFLFDEITVYLQVHIITAPAYKVLLGRPFDTITESLIKNDRDGGQTVTITDPNSGRRCTLPTYARGSVPKILKKPSTSDFRRSMN